MPIDNLYQIFGVCDVTYLVKCLHSFKQDNLLIKTTTMFTHTLQGSTNNKHCPIIICCPPTTHTPPHNHYTSGQISHDVPGIPESRQHHSVSPQAYITSHYSNTICVDACYYINGTQSVLDMLQHPHNTKKLSDTPVCRGFHFK